MTTDRDINLQWLRMSEETNALDNLERAVEFIHRAVAGETWAWKWVVLAAYCTHVDRPLYRMAIAHSTCRSPVVRKAIRVV